MDWLNYHHLYYFWLAAKEGTITAAAKRLHLTRPTVTAQIRSLEKAIGQKLFRQRGRGLVLTDCGQQVLQYADEIFAIGHELGEFVKSGNSGRRQILRVGMPHVLPQLLAYELLKPALTVHPRPTTQCVPGNVQQLMSDLTLHKLDLVLSDSPAPAGIGSKIQSHKLGECGLSLLAVKPLALKYRRNFPQMLTGAPMVVPAAQVAVRRRLDRWMQACEIAPEITAELEDSALLHVFGQAGQGIFPVPTAIESRVKKQFDVQLVGRIPEVLECFYAVCMKKRVQHPAVTKLLSQSRNTMFDV